MKRFFAKKASSQANKSQVCQSAQRPFASGPQKNPYASVLAKLQNGNSFNSYYSLPALGDKRVGKFITLAHAHACML